MKVIRNSDLIIPIMVEAVCKSIVEFLKFEVRNFIERLFRFGADTNGDPSIICAGGVKDGHYFLQILEDQTKRLLKLADHYEGALETPGLSEEVVGKIRSAAGKARLLVTQKMQQFRGLCSNNINQSADEAFPTTNEDLQGFWDMVMLQVDQVDNLFAEIEALKKNNWQEVKEAPKTTVVAKKPSKTQVSRAAKPTSAAQEEMRKKREQQRKQLIEERRKAMKSAQQQQQQLPNQDTIEIFVPAENS